jgi:tetratricopeptide (TPR) repeat protein
LTSLTLAGCATRPALPALAHARVADVPFVPGDDGLCGPATLAMLLTHAGQAVDLAALAGAVYVPGRGGSLQAEMLAAPRRFGRLSVALGDPWADLAAELAAGRPVGALVNLAWPWWPRWHYLVVTGFDGEQVQVHSGQQADVRWSVTTFESVWARSGRWAFVVLAPGKLPARPDEAAVLRALLAMDRSADPAAAAPSWMAATRRWPDSLTAAIGAGQAWMAAGDPAAAAAALEPAARRLDRAVLWNNLAMVRARLGDPEAARAAARRAADRARSTEPDWLPAALRTLAELGG